MTWPLGNTALTPKQRQHLLNFARNGNDPAPLSPEERARPKPIARTNEASAMIVYQEERIVAQLPGSPASPPSTRF
jgi:hypothetical protein